MKLSAYHKSIGDDVELFDYWHSYDLVYASKVFSFTEDIDVYPVNADELRKGGTGYCISVQNGREVFGKARDSSLPNEIEHIYPDYKLFPQYKFAVGFLTRGCSRNCGFCVVGKKEGLCSRQVADLSEFWHNHKEIKLLDPNILACKDHERLLQQLAKSRAKVDFTQGLDIRLTNPDNIRLLNQVKTPMLHFAWDNPKQDLTEHFKHFAEHTAVKSERKRIVYVLTNYNSTINEDLYRIYTLRGLGYSPYVMIYQKESAPKEIRRLQRWVNNRAIFRSCMSFAEYKG
ncbi:MAG: radical SAM protein [Oscillospiraceae bacterium]|nr:radical SAM protein [Oscillospiraceae bacterium]